MLIKSNPDKEHRKIIQKAIADSYVEALVLKMIIFVYKKNSH